MNLVQFKDPVSHMCPPGAVIASWSLTQDVAGSSPFTGMTNIFVPEFSENIWGKTLMGSFKLSLLHGPIEVSLK